MNLLHYLVLHLLNQTGLQVDCRNAINKQENTFILKMPQIAEATRKAARKKIDCMKQND